MEARASDAYPGEEGLISGINPLPGVLLFQPTATAPER